MIESVSSWNAAANALYEAGRMGTNDPAVLLLPLKQLGEYTTQCPDVHGARVTPLRHDHLGTGPTIHTTPQLRAPLYTRPI